jgi:hypothetical protein
MAENKGFMYTNKQLTRHLEIIKKKKKKRRRRRRFNTFLVPEFSRLYFLVYEFQIASQMIPQF